MPWNKKLTKNQLIDFYQQILQETEKNLMYDIEPQWNIARYTYANILLIQITNGCRISEAINAFQKYLENGEETQFIRVLKTRKAKKYRIVIIPPIVQRVNKNWVKSNIKMVNIANWVKKYFQRFFAIDTNTHTNRYAFITDAILERNINPIEVQKITKHSSLDLISRYTGEVEAEKTLKRLLGGINVQEEKR